jgi:predicted DNA-binding protein (MmcQ/YjbR family)
MNPEEIREYCISKAEVTESIPFGPDVIVFKTNEKVFLLLPLDSDKVQFNVKCDPELAIHLRDEFDCVLPGYHMNKKHWNTIVVDGTVSNLKLMEWIDHSYELVSSRSKSRKQNRLI